MTDSGVSAFHGKNSANGALGAFRKAVDKGDVPKGSFLLVESLDRLSRDQIPRALRQFLDLIEGGVTIVTLSDNMVYSQESISKGLENIIVSIIVMGRAYDESEMKSQRLKASWEQKRAVSGEFKMTSRAPAWLRLAPDRKTFTVIEERAKIVNQIYRDTLRGLGRDRIARGLNSSGCDTWGEGGRKGRKWHDSYVTKILENEAVIGRYQPHRMVNGKRVKVGEAIEGYYPPIVAEDLYYQVRTTRPGKPCMPGRTGVSVTNLFTHLAKCSRTGWPALYSDKGDNCRYLKSDATLPDGRKMKGWRYDEFEPLFFKAIGGLDLAAIFGEDRSDLDAARGVVSIAEAKVTEAEEKLTKLFAFVENYDGKPPASAHARLAELENERTRCVEQAEAATRDLNRAEQASQAAKQATQTLKELLAGTADVTVRLALRQEIRRIVERIDVTFDLAETAQEKEEREGLEQFAKMAKKSGAKILATADGDLPKRSFTIVFSNGVHRTVVEGRDGKPMVYEANEHGADFSYAIMLFDPTETPAIKRADPAPEPAAAPTPTSIKTKAKPSKKK